MSTSMQTTQNGGLKAWVSNEEGTRKITAMLGDIMETQQFISHMMTAFQDEKILHCSDKSKYQAIHECAVLGLLPTLDQVMLIPYKDTLKAMVTWQGFKAVMERHPKIEEVSATLVHTNDTVTRHGDDITHTFDPLDPNREIKSSADIKGGYVTVYFTNGRPPKYHFVTVKHIEKCRACAKTQNVWSKWYEQMALKTCFRDCYARRAVPVDPLVGERMERLLQHDEINLGNDPNRVEGMPQQPRQLTTQDIMGEPEATQQAAQEPQDDVIDVEPEPQPSGGPSPREKYLIYVDEAADIDGLTDVFNTARASDELSPDDLEIIKKSFTKKKAAFTRAANKANDETQ